MERDVNDKHTSGKISECPHLLELDDLQSDAAVNAAIDTKPEDE